MRDTPNFHWFEHFTRPRGPYISSWVQYIYSLYDELVQNSKKKAKHIKFVKSVMVRVKKMDAIVSTLVAYLIGVLR